MGNEHLARTIRPMGEPVGNGLTREAADELGLAVGTPVGVSIHKLYEDQLSYESLMQT